MVGWHHRLSGHEFEQALEDGEGQGSLACCSPWGRKESDTTERGNNKAAVKITTLHTLIKFRVQGPSLEPVPFISLSLTR